MSRVTCPPNAEPHFSPAPTAREGDVDAHLVRETRDQIRALVAEIEALAQQDLPLEDFYAGFLARIVTALAGVGGAVWTKSTDGQLSLAYQVNLPEIDLGPRPEAARHQLLIDKIWQAAGQPQLVPPHAGSNAPAQAGNPTDLLLVLAPLVVEQQTIALVEIFQRPGGGPTTQRGYLRFLVQMCALGSDYLKNRRLRQFQDRASLWEQFEAFLSAVHRKLDLRYTAYTLANEGRRVMGADRVSVLLGTSRSAQVRAVSGLDTLDRRAAELRAMQRLARIALAAHQPVWFAGDSSQLPPQMDDALHNFVDLSQARAVGVIPLFPPADDSSDKDAQRRPLGALVVERFAEGHWSEAARQRVLAVAEHGGAALANAREHQAIFLLPLWKALGGLAWLGKIPKLLLMLAVVATVIAGLVLVPGDFELAARGKLQPAVRRDIFASIDGVVVDVPVAHAQTVAPGQILAKLRNSDLELEIATLLGRKTTLEEQLSSLQRALLNESQLSLEQQNRIAGETLELRQTLESIDRQIALYVQKEAQLVVRSSQAGQVVSWQVRELLLGRPVQRGQVLMTLVDPAGDWQLELKLPEKRLGHALAAQQAASQAGQPLLVTFQLSTHPGQQFTGQVIEVERRAETQGEEGNVVLVRVAIDKAALPELHSETTVTAKLHCGQRPLGYVLFQDAIEAVQSKVLFWF
jgi:multidrug resistance efflux pump